jgi:hypothetical protein
LLNFEDQPLPDYEQCSLMTNPWFQLLPVFPGQYLIGGAMALYLTCSVGEEGLEPVYNILDLSNWMRSCGKWSIDRWFTYSTCCFVFFSIVKQLINHQRVHCIILDRFVRCPWVHQLTIRWYLYQMKNDIKSTLSSMIYLFKKLFSHCANSYKLVYNFVTHTIIAIVRSYIHNIFSYVFPCTYI